MVATTIEFCDALGHDSLAVGRGIRTGSQQRGDTRQDSGGRVRPAGDYMRGVLGELFVGETL
jgi:hypothetical protein